MWFEPKSGLERTPLTVKGTERNGSGEMGILRMVYDPVFLSTTNYIKHLLSGYKIDTKTWF